MPDTTPKTPVEKDDEAGHCPAPGIGLALSGGGARAIAFHLGCLRALHSNGLLARVDVISTVSGGSVIGALYACHDGDFSSFEKCIVALLKEGLVARTWRTMFTTRYGLFALLNWFLLFFVALIEIPIALLKRLLIVLRINSAKNARSITSYLRLHESRTTLLARTLDVQWFQGKTIDKLTSKLVINACDLTHGSAFYFSPKGSGSWRLGELSDNKQLIAEAVAASAAYPLALPALDKVYHFKKSSGEQHSARVSLTDGGVYDNTALSPFWPSRNNGISIAVNPVHTVIACRAGYGNQPIGFGHFLLNRMTRVFSAIQNRAENASIQRLFALHKSGEFSHVILPFLGQNDDLLSDPPKDLIQREEVSEYPTNFSAMNNDMIRKISLRGEQLTKSLLKQHAPELLTNKTETRAS